METIDKIKELMEKNNMRNADLARVIFNIPKNEPVPSKYRVRISDYFSRKSKIPYDILKSLAKYFNIDVNYFLENNNTIPLTHYLPVIGEASCGVPTNHFYYQDYDKIPVPAELYREGRYAVKAVGDSMRPRINPGDIVICDVNMYVNNGSIVHYTLNEESGIKKVIMDENNNPIMFMPLNDKYPPIPVKEDDNLRMARCFKLYSSL
jgi:repressor LexA